MNMDMTVWIVALVGVAAFGAIVYWLTEMSSRGRMMRCPETGAVSVVQVVRTAGEDAITPGLAVTQCDLWPQKKGCAQGCLARYRETEPGFRINLNALRPFEPQ